MKLLLTLAMFGFVAFICLGTWFRLTDLANVCHGVPECIAQGVTLRDDLTAHRWLFWAGFLVCLWLVKTGTGFEEEYQ